MHKLSRLSALLVGATATSLLLLSANTFAAETSPLEKQYNYGYDDGYEDGYDDAMDDCPCPPKKLWSGFYVGVGATYNSFNTTQKLDIESNFSASLRSNATGWGGKLLGGYGYNFPNKLYLGVEGYVDTTGSESREMINTGSTLYTSKIQGGTSYGINIQPGIQLPGKSLVYARLGYDRQNFQTKEWSSGAVVIDSSMSNWSNGFGYGVGIQTQFCPLFDARVEFDHINFNTITNNSTGTRFSPTDNQGSFSLLYGFPKF